MFFLLRLGLHETTTRPQAIKIIRVKTRNLPTCAARSATNLRPAADPICGCARLHCAWRQRLVLRRSKVASQPLFRTAETDAALRPALRTSSPRAQRQPLARDLI